MGIERAIQEVNIPRLNTSHEVCGRRDRTSAAPSVWLSHMLMLRCIGEVQADLGDSRW